MSNDKDEEERPDGRIIMTIAVPAPLAPRFRASLRRHGEADGGLMPRASTLALKLIARALAAEEQALGGEAS